VFLDFNLDGDFDAGDGEIGTLTDANGHYQFTDLVAGTYRVVAETPVGWIGTLPAAGHYDITVADDEFKSGSFDFGRFELGTIQGVKFHDRDADGARDDGEEGLEGWTIYLDLNQDGNLDVDEPSVVTGADGSYSFADLGPETLRVGEVMQAGWVRTSPSPELKITSGFADNPLSTQNVGNVQTEDVDGDGAKDDGEQGLAGWTIFLDLDGGLDLDENEPSVVTGADGRYEFTGLLPGSYILAEIQQDGWLQTSPLGTATARSVTTAGVDILITPEGCSCGANWGVPTGSGVDLGALAVGLAEGLTELTLARTDDRFANLDGSGVTTVVIDTGIDLDHPFFGPDADGDGVADRILFQYDFANNDADASDKHGHGSHVASLIASSDADYHGVATGADIIVLKVFEDSGAGYFRYVEEALQWVIENAETYNIGVVNMSLGDSGNWTDALPRYGLGACDARSGGHDRRRRRRQPLLAVQPAGRRLSGLRSGGDRGWRRVGRRLRRSVARFHRRHRLHHRRRPHRGLLAAR
jgi:hypothetical protein